MGMLQEVRVPDLGDIEDVPVIDLLVGVGDHVLANAPLITLESDKATMEVPAPGPGVVRELRVKVGDVVSEGSLILLLEAIEAVVTDPQEEAAVGTEPTGAVEPQPDALPVAPLAATTARGPAAAPSQRESGSSSAPPRASPAVRKLARQFGVDLSRVVPTGAGKRLLREDVEAFVRSALTRAGTAAPNGFAFDIAPWPQIDFAKFGPIERRPLSRIRKQSGPSLARNWVMIPHVTNFDEADISELERFRVALNREQSQSGFKVSVLSFIIKACARALRRYPELNSSLDGDCLIQKDYCHVGFAADTPHGLVVPVIRDADKKSLLELAREAGRLAALARDSKLKPMDMQGGCFTVSSLGGIGTTHFTPIINAPEVGILGVGRMQERLARVGDDIVGRQYLPLSFSWDHRVLDGATAARFLVDVAGQLSDVRRMIL